MGLRYINFAICQGYSDFSKSAKERWETLSVDLLRFFITCDHSGGAYTFSSSATIANGRSAVIFGVL